MNSNRYTEGYKRLVKASKRIAAQYNCNRHFVVCDALWAYVRYGTTPNEYIAWEFYRMSYRERCQYFTARHTYKYYPRFNPASFAKYFDDKPTTNRVFSKFITRKWLNCAEATIDEIAEFVKSHTKLIVKPSNQAQGKGVHIYKGEKPEELKQAKALLEEFVVQHPDIAALNSSSVNTIRVYTLKTAELPPLKCAKDTSQTWGWN